MRIQRPDFRPDPSLSHEAMASLQREIAAAASFQDHHRLDTDALGDGRLDCNDGSRALVAGVDQAFVGDSAVSAVVVSRDGEVRERATATVPTEIPYIPGLLAFREGGAVLAALQNLDCEPDVVLLDGSGRIHYREAGLATHVGATLGVPTVGVAKRLLCGSPAEDTAGGFREGRRVPIESDAEYETVTGGTVVGYAVQTRQFTGADRHVNPLYVSPGHRTSADTAADLALVTATEYKLPEPIRLADAGADAATAAAGDRADT